MLHEDILGNLDELTVLAKADQTLFPKGRGRELFLSRVAALRALVATLETNEPPAARIDEALFKNMDPASRRTSFARFRTQLKSLAAAHGRRFELIQPKRRKADRSEVRCTFAGDAAHRNAAVDFARAATSFMDREHEFIETHAHGVNIFISFTVADKRALTDEFTKMLRNQMPLSCDLPVHFWRFDQQGGLLPGEDNEAEIVRQMKASQFGLLLLSPAYLERPFIKRVELPYFLGPGRRAHPIPVAFADFQPGMDKHPDLDPANVFTMDGKCFHQTPAKKRPAFIKALCAKICELIQKSPAPPALAESALAMVREGMEIVQQLSEISDDPQARESAERRLQEIHDALVPVEKCGPLIPHLATLLTKLQPAPKPNHGLPAELSMNQYIHLFARAEGALAKSAVSHPDNAENGVPLLSHLIEWFDNPSDTAWMALLGEAGAGKSMTCGQLVRTITARGGSREAIYLNLQLVNEGGLLKRNRNPDLTTILTTVLGLTRDTRLTAAAVLRAVREQGALVVWDGLDEVLVHLSATEGTAFYKQLMETLPGQAALRQGAGRLLIACRTHYFRSFEDEGSTFSGSQRSEIHAGDDALSGKRNRFRVLRILPFDEAQIRDYLTANLPSVDVGRAMEVIGAVHNLRDLAARPYLLSLMRLSLPDFEKLLASGKSVRSIDLYRKVVAAWLLRDQGKHRIDREDKARIMQALAHHMWSEGAKSLPIERIEWWLRTLISSDRVLSDTYRERLADDDKRDEILQDLRTATFLGRWDGEAFRFAHTSLQEYFLASYLVEALEAGNLDSWALPMPSQETLDFLTEMWEKRHEESPAAARRLESGLGALLETSSGERSQVALAFYLRISAKGNALPSLRKIDCQGLDLTAWKFHGTPTRPLRLPGADFSGACLIRASFEHVEFANGSRWNGADLRSAEWIGCGLENADFTQRTSPQGEGASCPPATNLTGTIFRACRLAGSRTDGASPLTTMVHLWLCHQPDPAYWPSLPPTTHPSLQSQIGHANWVMSVGFSPDGKQVVSGSQDKTVRLWDAATGHCLRVLPGHANGVMSVAFSPNGKQVVSGSEDRTVRLWNAATGHCLRVLSGHEARVWSVGFSPNGKQVISGSSDKTVRLWDAVTGHCLRILLGHAKWVLSVGFSPDGNQVASGSSDKTVRLWDAATGHCLRVLSGHEYEVLSVGFSPDGKQVVSGSYDNTVRLWDAANCHCLRVLCGHENAVQSVGFSSDGKQVVSSSWDNTMRLWDAATGNCLRVVSGYENAVCSVGFSPDGKQVVSGSDDRTVRLWDAATGHCLRVLSGHEKWVWTVAFSPDGKQVVSKDIRSEVRCWRVADGSQAQVPAAAKDWLNKQGEWERKAAFDPELLGQSTLRLTHQGQLLRDIIPLPDGNSLVLEPWDETEARKPANECRWKLVSGPADAWRYLATIDRANGTVHPLEASCPEGSWRITGPVIAV